MESGPPPSRRGAEGDPVFWPGVGGFAADASSPWGAEGDPVFSPGVGGFATSPRGGPYALVTPVRDDAALLAGLGPTVVAQTIRPTAWVIVDDGSTDGTAEVARELAAEHSWIKVIHTGRENEALSEGRREGRDLLALQAGLRELREPVELWTKLDADITLPPDYFERLGEAFAADPRLGLATGTRSELEDGEWKPRHLTAQAVAAQCRTYRWDCWEQVQPLEPRLGWDGVDEARAVVNGWRTRVVPDLYFRHHRPMGRRDGSRFRARAAEGIAAHYMGYRFSYLFVRSLWHARRDPAALGMVWGWTGAVLRRERPCDDPAVREHVRRQQAARHFGRRFREVRSGNA